MAHVTNRRSFLKTAGVTAAGFWVAGGVASRGECIAQRTLGMASIGIGGKGHSDSDDAASHGDMVAICDVDKSRLAGALKRFPRRKGYTDFRKMLDEMGKSIDAVTVSTPDHMHAPASLMAMRMGIHCFCQKPLTRTIYEARLMGQVARENKLATQMGNQGRPAIAAPFCSLAEERRHRHGQGAAHLDGSRQRLVAAGSGPPGTEAPAIRICLGICGWAWRPNDHMPRDTIPSTGVAGGILAPVPWRHRVPCRQHAVHGT